VGVRAAFERATEAVKKQFIEEVLGFSVGGRREKA
jgi:hypothetical protein